MAKMTDKEFNSLYDKFKTIDLGELFDMYKAALLSAYRHYEACILIRKCGDKWSSYNSFYLSTEESLKAYNINILLSQRQQGLEITETMFRKCLTGFFSHEIKMKESIKVIQDHVKKIMEPKAKKLEEMRINQIINAMQQSYRPTTFFERYRQRKTTNSMSNLFDSMETYSLMQSLEAHISQLKNIIDETNSLDWYKLKNKSIYLDIHVQMQKFTSPEETIRPEQTTKMKNIAGLMGEINHINTKKHNKIMPKLGIKPIDWDKETAKYSFRKKP